MERVNSFLTCFVCRSAAAEKMQDTEREARYKAIVQRRKIVDLAQAQAQEIALLRAEVERLRMRTFAALVHVDRWSCYAGHRAAHI